MSQNSPSFLLWNDGIDTYWYKVLRSITQAASVSARLCVGVCEQVCVCVCLCLCVSAVCAIARIGPHQLTNQQSKGSCWFLPKRSTPLKYFGAKSQHGRVAFQRKVPETNCGPTSASMLGVGPLKGESTIARFGNLPTWFRFLPLWELWVVNGHRKNWTMPKKPILDFVKYKHIRRINKILYPARS